MSIEKLSLRHIQWNSLFLKYTNLSKFNLSSYSLSEVTEEHLIDSDRPDTDTDTDANYSQSSENWIDNVTYTNKNNVDDVDYLTQLIFHVNEILSSNLKELLNYRTQSQILESDEYPYWHELTKREMTRLKKYISHAELRDYMDHCYDYLNIKALYKIIVYDLNSKLKELLFQRELLRTDETRLEKHNNKIKKEWKRLNLHLPFEKVVFYARMISISVRQRIKAKNSLLTKDYLLDLVQFIEVKLGSKLKELLLFRSGATDSNEYIYWHQKSKLEMSRLRKFIKENELKYYMNYCKEYVKSIGHQTFDTNCKMIKLEQFEENVPFV